MFLFLTHFTLYIGTRFIYLIRTDSNVFLFMAEKYSIVYMYHHFFIHSSVDGHLGCFHVLAIGDSAAMNNGIHVSLSVLVSSRYMPRSGTAGSYGSSLGNSPVFWGISILSSLVAVSIYIPTNSARPSLFSTPSPAFIVCRLFDEGHSDRGEVISHCGFDLHFSSNEWCWASFHVFVSHLYVFFGEMSV